MVPPPDTPVSYDFPMVLLAGCWLAGWLLAGWLALLEDLWAGWQVVLGGRSWRQQGTTLLNRLRFSSRFWQKELASVWHVMSFTQGCLGILYLFFYGGAQARVPWVPGSLVPGSLGPRSPGPRVPGPRVPGPWVPWVPGSLGPRSLGPRVPGPRVPWNICPAPRPSNSRRNKKF